MLETVTKIYRNGLILSRKHLRTSRREFLEIFHFTDKEKTLVKTDGLNYLGPNEIFACTFKEDQKYFQWVPRGVEKGSVHNYISKGKRKAWEAEKPDQKSFFPASCGRGSTPFHWNLIKTDLLNEDWHFSYTI